MAADGWEKSFEDENLDDTYGPAIDDAILMKLLDESASEEADGDRLESVIRSLEDDIGAAGMAPEAVHRGEDCEDCGLDDILSDLDGHDCSRSSTSVVEDSLGWTEIGVATPVSGTSTSACMRQVASAVGTPDVASITGPNGTSP